MALLRERGKLKEAYVALRGELTLLDLESCQIGDDGAEIVAAFLQHDETVREVHLWDCRIGLRGAKAIACALQHNETIRVLSLDGNQITNKGAEALIGALNSNVSIIALNVNANTLNLKAKVIIKYRSRTRNRDLIPAAARRASLYIITAHRTLGNAGDLSILPKEIVKMIAMEVYATRREPIWIRVLSEFERTGKSD